MSQAPAAKIRSLMAFDFGTQRIGIAMGQRLTGTAQPLNPHESPRRHSRLGGAAAHCR